MTIQEAIDRLTSIGRAEGFDSRVFVRIGVRRLDPEFLVASEDQYVRGSEGKFINIGERTIVEIGA
jgi:hypothetical protein